MKALLVHQGAELYGSDRSFASSCKAFYELGIELTILLPEYGALVEEVERYGSVIIVDFGVLRKSALKKKPFTEIWRLARGYFYARSMLKEFDLIYVNTIVNLTFILALNKYRGLKYVHVREMPLGVVNKVFRRVLKYSGAKLIYNSFSVKDSFQISGEVVYNGVSVETRDFSVENTESTKKLSVLFVGRLNDWKGADLLLESCKILDDKNILSRIDVVGDCFPGQEQYKSNVIDLAKELKQISVELHGFCRDTESFYKCADIVIVPSRRPEPFGRVVVEAMAFGCCVIIANHGGMTEIIEDGVDGFVFEPNNSVSLASVIQTVCESSTLKNKISMNARESYLARFTEEAYVKNIQDLIRCGDDDWS